MKVHNLFGIGATIFALSGCETNAVNPVTPSDTTKVVTKTYQQIMDSLMVPEYKGQIGDPRDGTIYPWVKIGYYKVFSKNLSYRSKVGNFSFNPYADSLMAGLDSNRIIDSIGYAYDRAASEGACPEGWHIPTQDEWIEVSMRGATEGGRAWPNPSVERLFNRWAIAKTFGGKDSLQLHLSPTYGIDLEGDSAVKRRFISYATSDLTVVSKKTLVFRLNSDSLFLNGGDGYGNGNTLLKRDTTEFSYIRCFQLSL